MEAERAPAAGRYGAATATQRIESRQRVIAFLREESAQLGACATSDVWTGWADDLAAAMGELVAVGAVV